MNDIDFSLFNSSCNTGELPVAEKYHQGKNTLLFIGTYHTHDYISSDNEVFNLIRESFNTLLPDATIIEGEYSHLDLTKCSINSYISSLLKTSNKVKIGEPYYTAYLSQKCNIPYFGAELSPEEIKDILNKSQFTYQDYVFFLYLITLNGRRDLEEKDAIKLAQKHFFEFHDVNFDDGYTLSDFKVWYGLKQNKKYNRKTIGSSEVAPLYDQSIYFSQRLNSELNYYRNKKLVQVIKDHLINYNKLLVVYGGGHYYQLKDVLRNLFD